MKAVYKIFNLYMLSAYPHGDGIGHSQAATEIYALVAVRKSDSTPYAFSLSLPFGEVVEVVSGANRSVLFGFQVNYLKYCL
jgi:hypothetical protein